MIESHTDLTPADHFRTGWYLGRRAPSALLLQAGLVAYTVGALAWGRYRYPQYATLANAIPPVIACIIFVALLPLPRAIAAMMMARRTPSALGPCTVRLDEHGIHVLGALSHGTVAWPGIVRVAASRRYVYFYLNRSMALFLAVRGLPRSLTGNQAVTFATERLSAASSA